MSSAVKMIELLKANEKILAHTASSMRDLDCGL